MGLQHRLSLCPLHPVLDITQIAKKTIKCKGNLFKSDIGKQGQFKEGGSAKWGRNSKD